MTTQPELEPMAEVIAGAFNMTDAEVAAFPDRLVPLVYAVLQHRADLLGALTEIVTRFDENDATDALEAVNTTGRQALAF